MGMSHRHTDRVVSFFVCLGCVGGGGGGGISSLKQILHTHYKYHTDTLRLNCWKVFCFCNGKNNMCVLLVSALIKLGQRKNICVFQFQL